MPQNNHPKADEVMTKICTGLSTMLYPIKGMPLILELGIRELQALYILHFQESLPCGHDSLFKLFERPLQEWWPGDTPNFVTGTLVAFGQPTQLCMDFALAERFGLAQQLAEVDEQIMADILLDCRRDTKSLQKQYIASRQFLIENPTVKEAKLMSMCVSGKLHHKVQQAYEMLPSECILEGYVYFCHHCGDALAWQESNSFCRNWVVCQRKGKYRRKNRAKADGLLRVKRGIMAYVTIPGQPELALFRKLKQMGVEVDLWPGIDHYDLRLQFSDGAVWAIDVKTSKAPTVLGRKERENGLFPNYDDPFLRWNQAFYVIPTPYYDKFFSQRFTDGAGTSFHALATQNIYLVPMSKMVKQVCMILGQELEE